MKFGLVVATWMGVQKYLAWRRGVDDWLNYLPAGFFMGLIYSLPGAPPRCPAAPTAGATLHR